jgi:hemin uptake protein HemP
VAQDVDDRRAGSRASPGPTAARLDRCLGGGPPAVTSEALLRGGRELVIRHGGEEYRLRLTGNNKLILTK